MARILRRHPVRRPELSVDRGPQPARALVVMLPGGPETGFEPTRPWSAPYVRLLPFGRAIRRASHERIAVVRVRHRHTGWNGGEETTLAEARILLDEVGRHAPHLPVGLLGHSLGGRTALRAAGHRSVRSVVALAPWVPPTEPVDQLGDRHILVVAGLKDTTCPVTDTDSYVRRARDAGAQVRYERVEGSGHGMIRRAQTWHDLATNHLVRTLLDD